MVIFKDLTRLNKNRESNIELARIVSMFLILVIHANMVSLKCPSKVDLLFDSTEVIFRFFVESIGIVSVNLFVLISGWFKIKPTRKRILSFVYQVAFLWGGMLFVSSIINQTPIGARDIASVIALTRFDWFIKAYLVLCILSPVLNSFVENSAESLYKSVLIWFFLFQSTYGILGASRFFVEGYGPLSFIGLYLLAQYSRLVRKGNMSNSFFNRMFLLKKEIDFLIFFACVLINTVIGVLSLMWDLKLYSLVYAYLNPLNVIGSLYLFLFFTKIDIGRSSVINYLAASSFAVYLLHGNQMRGYFTNIIQYLYNTNNGIGCVFLIFLFLIFVYFISVVIDQMRIVSWNVLCKLKKYVRL